MKNFLFTLIIIAGCLIANAQWSDDPTENNRITPLGVETYDFDLGMSSNGTSFVAYTRPMGDIATFLQIIDVNGNMLFPDEGKMISHERTISWTQVNQLLFVDDDGNAIISVSDCRNSSGEDLSYTLYKVSPTGEMLWGENGIDLCGGMAYGLIACMNIIQLENGDYVCAWMVEGNNVYIQLQKISKQGALLWGDAVKISETSASNDYPYLVNAGNNQVIVAYSRVTGSVTTKNLRARKIASDGSNVWANDVSIYTGYFGYVPLWVNMRVIPDEMGGAFVGWYDTRDNPNKESTYVAHVKSNGTLGFNGAEGGVKVGHSALRSFFPEMYVNTEEGFLYVTWRETSNDMSQSWQQMTAQKLNISSGELMWNPNGIAVSPYTHNHSISFYSIQNGGNGNATIFFTSNTYHPQYLYGWDINSIILINGEGGYVWEDEIIQFSNPVSMKSRLVSTPLVYNSFWLAAWSDERVVTGDPGGSKKIYMQRINIDGALGSGNLCLPPTEVTVEFVSETSAVISWNGETDDYEVEYRIVDENWSSVVVMGAHSFTLENLIPATNYEVHIRSICSDDVSTWSAIIPFTTLNQPPCEPPVNLNVTEITTFSAILSWDEGNEYNLSWELRYKEATNANWNNVDPLEEKTYLLEELTPNTAYLWTVRAICEDEQTSEWAENGFTTEPVGINETKKEQMTVYFSGKMLSIINAENRFIERVQLFGTTGNLLGEYGVNSTDNVLIPTTLSEMIVIVKIVGINNVETHKVLVR
jgi:hypothetical protein